MAIAPATGQITAGLMGIQPLILEPEIYRKLINIYRDNDFMRWADLMGVWRPTKAIRYSNYTEDPLTGVFDLTGVTVTTTGNVTVTLTVVPHGATIVGQLYKCVSGAQAGIAVGRVQSITPGATDTVVLKSVNATVLTLAAGDKLVPVGNAQEEASNAPDPVKWSLTPTTNQVQIFRKGISISDIAKAQHYRVDLTDENGNTSDGIFSYEQWRGYCLHRTEMAQSFWGAEPGTSFFDDIAGAALTGARGNSVQVSRGIESYIRAYGTSATLSTPGTFTQAELESFNNALDVVNGPDEYMLVGGNPAVQRFGSFLKNLGSSGVTSVRMVVEGKEIDMEVDRYQQGGRTFYIKRWNIFDNTQYFSTGNSVSKALYAIPMGEVATKDEGSMPYLNVRYMPVRNPNLGTEQIAEVHTGALANPATSGVAEEGVIYHSIAGVEVLAPQKFAKWNVL